MERIWVEINSRVNYPVNLCLVESGELNTDLQSHKFCVLWFAIRVCSVGTKLAVDFCILVQVYHIYIYIYNIILLHCLYPKYFT